MVIDFGVKNPVVSLWKSLFGASIQKAQNGPSTQLIEATRLGLILGGSLFYARVTFKTLVVFNLKVP